MAAAPVASASQDRRPGATAGLASGAAVGPRSAATYALTVLLPPEPEPLALRLLTASTALRLSADGVVVAEAGSVGATSETSRPAYRPQVVRLAPRRGLRSSS